MRRNPIYVFKNFNSIGIFDVPIGSMVQVVDSDGKGTPLFTQLIKKDGLHALSPISDFLRNPNDFINLDKDTVSELEKIEVNGTKGWRLLGKDAANYGNLGEGAIDLSDSTTVGQYGAMGDNSFAVGKGTLAQNTNSVALGSFNVGTDPDTILEVGNGIASFTNNVLEVFEDGTIVAPNATIAKINSRSGNTLVTAEYVANAVLVNTIAIANKVDIAQGKQLTTNDFTDDLKLKLLTMEGSHFKGIHLTITALALAHPAGLAEAGSYAYIYDGVNPQTIAMIEGGLWVEQDSGIGGSGVTLTAPQIKALYESNADTNPFTNADVDTLTSALQLIDLDGIILNTAAIDDNTLAINNMGGLIDTNRIISNDNKVLSIKNASDIIQIEDDIHDGSMVGLTKSIGTSDSSLATTAFVAEAIIAGNGVITVVDDLTTGGSTEALSAEQGKVLQDTKVDVEAGKGLSTNDYDDTEKALVASTSQDLSGMLTNISKNASDIIQIGDDIYDGNTPGFTQPVGTSGRSLATTAFVAAALPTKAFVYNPDITYPVSAIVTLNNIAYVATNEVAADTSNASGPDMNNDWVQIGSNIIDDLTTGGTTDALSAEQGKVLQDTKVDIEAGKDLSTNDYDDIEKALVANLEENSLGFVDVKTVLPKDGQILKFDETKTNPSWVPADRKDGIRFSTSVAYEAGDAITYENKMYFAIVDTGPGLIADQDWVASREHGGVAWESSNRYLQGDIVSKDNNLYIAATGSHNINPVEVISNEWKAVAIDKTYDYEKVGGIGNEILITSDTFVTILDSTFDERPAGLYEYKHSITFNMDVPNRSVIFRFSLDGGTTWEERSKEVKDAANIEDSEMFFPFVAATAFTPHYLIEARVVNTNDTCTVIWASQVLERKR